MLLPDRCQQFANGIAQAERRGICAAISMSISLWNVSSPRATLPNMHAASKSPPLRLAPFLNGIAHLAGERAPRQKESGLAPEKGCSRGPLYGRLGERRLPFVAAASIMAMVDNTAMVDTAATLASLAVVAASAMVHTASDSNASPPVRPHNDVPTITEQRDQ